MENLQNLQFGKFENFSVWKITKNRNSEDLRNLQYGKFEKFAVQKIPKNVKIKEIRKIFAVENSKSFPNFTVCKIVEFLKLYNFEKQ